MTISISWPGLTLLASIFIALHGQSVSIASVSIHIEARVREPNGQPIPGATVSLALPRYGIGDRGIKVESVTDSSGIAILSGYAQQDYSLSVQRQGYYPTIGPRRGINDEKSLMQYAVGTQKFDFELRPVRAPVKGIARMIQSSLPAIDQALGFDLEVGDWIIPFGSGKTPDLVFKVGGYFKDMNDYEQLLTLSFSNFGDGIVIIKTPPRLGSVLKLPYEAPSSGYEQVRQWRKFFNGKEESTTFDATGETNYILRVRTVVDKGGNFLRAMHGAIFDDITLGGNNQTGRYIRFTYALNPDWTPNIEFDPSQISKALR